MKIKPYTPKLHDKHLKLMLSKRSMDPKMIYDLPEIGLCLFEERKCVAAVFLRKVEGKWGYGLVDTLITDPDFPAARRQKAIHKIFHYAPRVCKRHGIRNLIFTTDHESIVQRAITFGFEVKPQYVCSVNMPLNP